MRKSKAIIDKEVLKTVQEIQSHQHDIDLVLDKIQHDIQNMNVDIESLKGESEQTRKAINDNAERVKTRVMAALEPVTDATRDLTAGLKEAENVTINKDKRSLVEKYHLKAWLPGLIVIVVAGIILYVSIVVMRR